MRLKFILWQCSIVVAWFGLCENECFELSGNSLWIQHKSGWRRLWDGVRRRVAVNLGKKRLFISWRTVSQAMAKFEQSSQIVHPRWKLWTARAPAETTQDEVSISRKMAHNSSALARVNSSRGSEHLWSSDLCDNVNFMVIIIIITIIIKTTAKASAAANNVAIDFSVTLSNNKHDLKSSKSLNVIYKLQFVQRNQSHVGWLPLMKFETRPSLERNSNGIQEWDYR